MGKGGDDYDEKIKQAIPAEVHMISGSHDSQTSADVSNVGNFRLPDPAGKPGGACTSALLQVLYKDHTVPSEPLSWIDCLQKMRNVLRSMGFDQIPQLTSSRVVDVHKTMSIVPPTHANGRKRAVLIGINYKGQQGELSGCHNDVKNIKEYLIDVQKFPEKDMLILMDDGKHHKPTRENIITAYQRVVEFSNAGDVVFCHYSGHGGQLRDDDGDEDDGFDETLIPVDFQKAGQIRDDELLIKLVKPMKRGVVMTALMDCCHSGTVLDLPYRFTADGSDAMIRNENAISLQKLLGTGEAAVAICCCIACLASILNDM